MTKLLDAATADGAGSAIQVDGSLKTLTLQGTLDGATVQISYKPAQEPTVFTDASSLAFTGNDVKNCQLAPGEIKATVASAGASTNITMYIG